MSEHYKKLYTTLLDAIPSSVLLIDREMHIVSVNRNFLEKSRCSLSNTIGHHLESVFSSVILDCIKLTSQVSRAFDLSGTRCPHANLLLSDHPLPWKSRC